MHTELFAKMGPITDLWVRVHTYFWMAPPPFSTPKEPPCTRADTEVFLDLRSGLFISLLQQKSASASSFVLGVSGWEQNFNFTPFDQHQLSSPGARLIYLLLQDHKNEKVSGQILYCLMQDILNSYCVCICPFVNCWFIPFAYFFLDIQSVWCFTSYTYHCLCCWNTGTFSSWHQGNLTGAGILPNRRSYSSSHCLREHLSLVDHFPTISISFLLASLVCVCVCVCVCVWSFSHNIHFISFSLSCT